MNTFFLKIFIFVFICFGLQNKSYATHIVGGEITVRWTGIGSIYEVTLTKYDNEVSGFYNNNNNSVSTYENVYLWESNRWTSITLELISNLIVPSSSIACNPSTQYQTYHQVYRAIVDLSNYFVTSEYIFGWKLCCRNSLITNIIKKSTIPQEQEIYLATRFTKFAINSTPIFRPLGNEFFCKGMMNSFDLSATDTDGDSLVYSLDTPQTDQGQDVIWINSSYSGSNPIPGTVPFTINSRTGRVSFNPSQSGIFLFGIKVEEYRNGVKIGQVRKEFQFNVQECTTNNKPEIAFQNRAIKTNDTLTIQLKDKLCFPIYVTDIDAANMFMSQTIQFIQSPNNTFPVAAISLPTEVNLNGFRPKVFFDMCFDPCAGGLRLNETTYYPHEIIITDNRCPIQYDTLHFTLKVEVRSNEKPEVFIDPLINPKISKVNNLLTYSVYATDQNTNDILTLTMYNGQRAMSFQNVTDSTSTISSTFNWTPNCNDLQPGVYDVYFIVDDNSCTVNSSDTIYQQIIIEDNEADFSNINVTNLITPNGDGLNDFYYVPGIPVGNCEKYFKGIEIYNRWGAPVFYSEDRFFKWDPKESDGIYYFSIDLNYKTIKGWIQIVR